MPETSRIYLIPVGQSVRDMREEALRELDHDAFSAAVRDVLESEPNGLRSTQLQERLHEENTAPPMKYLHH